MSKGLEALKRIDDEEPIYHSTLYDRDMWKEDIETVRKNLIALKIIVKKANIRLWENHGNYYFTTTNNVYGISKEKYDLLKEVLNK